MSEELLGALRPIVINQSGMKEYLDCRRLYAWKRVQGIEADLRRSALEIGIAVHAALAVFHADNPAVEAQQYLPAAAAVAAGEAGKVVPFKPLPQDRSELAVFVATDMLTRRSGIQSAFEDKSLSEADEITRRTLEGYFKHWGDKAQLWTPLHQEVQFLVEVRPGWWRVTFDEGEKSPAQLKEEWSRLPRSGVFLRGRADNLAVVPGIGLYDVDYKTAARMDPRDMLKYELDMQPTFYIYAITKQLTTDSVGQGKPPLTLQGAIIDLLVKTKTPQYAREIFTRSNAELAEFELEIIEYGREMRGRLDRVERGEDWKVIFGKNTQHCFRWGVCPMREVCLKDTPTRRQLYRKRTPDYVDEAQARLDKEWREKRGVDS